jgi:mRNA interferase YafQ
LLSIVITKKFKKEFNKFKMKLDFSDLQELFKVISKIQNNIPLEAKYNDHSLSGNYSDCRDCHIKPDLVLIYYIKDNDLILERLNSHSELFN